MTRLVTRRSLAGTGRSIELALVLALALVFALTVAGCASTAPPAGTSGASPSAVGSVPPVVRQILAAGLPSAAPQANLELVRYTIQPGTALAAHHHPGMQLALIESGTLTYTVIEGTVTVHEVDGGTRQIGPGQTGLIAGGEWIAEDESIVHFGRNAGEAPVVILASSLLAVGQPPAIVVSPAPP